MLRLSNTFILCCLIALTNQSTAQVNWEKLFSKPNTAVFRSVIEVPGGGYLASGYTSEFSVKDTNAFIVKLTSTGDTVWTRSYGDNGKDLVYRAINTSDGGFILCGYSTSYGNGSDDAYVIKTNNLGIEQWRKTYGGIAKDRAQEIVQTLDGGYAFCGYTNSGTGSQGFNAYLVKLNSSGDTVWSKRYGGLSYDDANSLKQLPDSGFIIVGQTFSYGMGAGDVWLIRTNSLGDTLWTKTIGTAGTDNGECVNLAAGGGFIISGSTSGAGSGGDDGYLIRTDDSGNVIWSKYIGGVRSDDIHNVENTIDGGFICSGTTQNTPNLISDIWLVKTNSSGDTLWTKRFGLENHDHGYFAIQASDGGFVLVGYAASFGFNFEEALIVKTDSAGNVMNRLRYIAISNIISPDSTSCGSSNSMVKIILRNFGEVTVPNVPATVQITGAITQTLNETYAGAFFPNDSDTLVFLTPINTLSGGVFNFNCIANIANDVYPANNSFSRTIRIPGYPSSPLGTGASRCGPGTVTLFASSPDTITWYNAASGGSAIGNGSSFITPSISSTTTFYAQAGLQCPSARTPVVATVNPVSSSPTTFSNQRCGPGTITLLATANESVTWWDSPTGGNQVGSGNSYTTPVISSTTVYHAQAGTLCPSARVAATATINPVSPDPVGSPGFNCGPGTVLISATAPDQIVWYNVSTGGSPVGAGTSYTTPFISTTTTYYAQAGTTCPSNRIPVDANILPVAPDPVTTAGSNCGPGTVSLSAASPDTVYWFDSASGGSLLGTGLTFSTPVISNTTIFYAQAGMLCPSNRIAATATIHTLPVVSLGPDTLQVSGTSFLLDAGAGFVSYTWTTGDSTQTTLVNTTNTYCVTVIDSNNCQAFDCIYIDFTTIVPEHASSKMVFYPNPVNRHLYISNIKSNGTISLFSTAGIRVFSDLLTSNSSNQVTIIDLKSIANGYYILEFNDGKEIFRNRISIIH